MGTFNAGAIESKLTLDRSAWNRELKGARAEAQKFQQDGIKPKLELRGKEKLDELAAQLKRLDGESVDIRADISGDAVAEMKRLEAQVKKLDTKSVDISTHVRGIDDLIALEALIKEMDPAEIHLDLNVDRALETLGVFEALIAEMNGKDVDLDIKLHGEEKLAALAVAVETLDGKNIDLDVKTGGGVQNAAEGFTRMQAIVAAILVLLPLVPPVAATATGAVMGLAAGLTAAAGALGVVGLAVAPTVLNLKQLYDELDKQKTKLAALTPGSKEYIKQQEKIKNLTAEMNDKFGPASTGLQILGKAWGEFTKATQGDATKIIGSFFQTLAALLPPLVPIFNAAAPVVTGMFDSIKGFAKGPEMKRVTDFFADFGSSSLQSILDIGGNLIKFLGRLFEAFAPFGKDLLKNIDDLTASWAEWADGIGKTKGFQDFIAYVNTDGPKVWDLIKNMVDAIINFGVALAPLGSFALDAFNGIFSFIAEMDPSVLGAIAVAIGGVVTGLLAVTAALAVWNFLLNANPIGLVIVAIVALVAAIVYLWNNNQTFHDAVVAIWDAIKAVIGAVVDWFTGTVVPMFQTAWAAISGFFSAAWAEIGPIVMGIGQIIGLMVQIVIQYFSMVWQVVGPIVHVLWMSIQVAFQNIWIAVSTVVRNIWGVISAVFTTIVAFWRGVFSVMGAIAAATWNVIKAVIIGAINVIKAVLNAVLAAMKGDWSGAFRYMHQAVTSSMNAIRNIVSAVINGIRSVISTGVNAARSVATTAFNSMYGAISGALNRSLGAVRSIIGNIRGLFSGAASWLIDAGRSIIQGLINGITNMGGAVRDAVEGVLSRARNLLPFSPAKEGPFSGKGWTLYSGMSIVDSLAEGILSRKDALRDATRSTIEAAQPDLSLTAGIGVGALAGAGLSGVAGSSKTINVNVTNYNPIEEKSSVTTTREVNRLAALGAFDG